MSVLGADQLLAPLRDALRDVAADEADLRIHRRRSAMTRYGRSQIYQNAVFDELRVHARAVVGRAVGAASGNSLAPDDLRALLRDAAALAMLQPPNEEWAGMAGPAPYAQLPSFDAPTAVASAAEQASAIRVVCAAADGRGLRAAGTHAVDITEDALANSHGLTAYAPATTAYLKALVLGDHGGSGYADDLAAAASALNAHSVASRAIAKCERDRGRRSLPAGDYEAVFEDLAVAEVLRYVAQSCSAQAMQDGRSFMSERVGQRVTGPRFTLHDDALDPRGLAVPFDVEGTPKQRVALVEGGVVRGPVHDRGSAKAMVARSTGHAADPGRYQRGGTALNLVMAGGDATTEELIAAVTRGVLITRFHYTNSPDPTRATMTGTTRDGTFLIEDGRITAALPNLRYQMSALDLFGGIDLLGRQRLVRDWWATNGMSALVCIAPAIKVSRATITGASPLVS